MDLSLVFANTAQLDLQNSVYILGSDQLRTVESGGYGWLFILAGVGGAGVYLARHMGVDSEDQDQLFSERFTSLMWIFEDQERSEENSDPFYSVFLRGFNLGILSPNRRTATKPAIYPDLSLNSFSGVLYPQKFLRQPFHTKELMDTKSKGDKIKENNEIKTKRSPFNKRMKKSKGEMILQRVVATNRLSFKFFKPGEDLRMEGDGCEHPADFCETKNSISEKKNLTDRCSISCFDHHCNSPQYLQRETESQEAPSWMEFLQNTEELRRFIRETSFDSLASDISFGINFNLEEKDEEDSIQDNLTDASSPPIEENSYSKQIFNENNLWKLTDIPDEADDDNRSFAGSVLDNWEWDEECYYAEDTLAKDDDNQNIDHQSWLPDACHELDLEAELCDSHSSSPSSRCSSTCGRVTPAGRECRTDYYTEGE